jgi:oligopeptide transport system ATP-binding protein
MLHGKQMEVATTQELFANPLHPYTRSLLSAVPVPDPIYERNKQLLDYDVKNAKIDGEMVEISPGHYVLK